MISLTTIIFFYHCPTESTYFVTRCAQNRMFKNKGLSVRPLELTEQIVVEDIQNLNEDVLQMYFEKEGGDVENIVVNEVEQSAVITFKDHKDVQKMMKKKHHIKQKEIRVYPFCASLGIALYGKDKPSLKLPAAILESIDCVLWRYLNDNQLAAESIQSDLAKHFCNVNLGVSPVCLSPMSSLLKQKDAKAIIKEWDNTVKTAFAQAVSKFKSLTFQLEQEVWEKSQENIRQTLQNKDVAVVLDKASGVLSVVGLVDDVNSLEQTLHGVVQKIVKNVKREQLSKTQVIKVSPSILHILQQDGLLDKLLCVYPELKMSSRKDSSDITFTGLSEEILSANKMICEAVLSLKRRVLELDDFVIDMLKGEEQEELTKTLLISSGKNAAFEISALRVQLVAVSDSDLNDAEDHLGKLLKSQYIDVEDSNVIEKPDWQHLVSQLEDANSKSCRRLRICITGQQVVVSGHQDTVMKVSRELEEYLKQNAQVEEVLVVKSNAIVEYIKKCNPSFSEQVAVSYKNEAICLSGSRVDVANCKIVFEDLVNSLFFEKFKVSKTGVKKLFKNNGSMYFSSLLNNTECVVQMLDESSGSNSYFSHGQGSKPVYQLQTAYGVEIAVCEADMCSYPVHAVVNSSSPDLKHSGGLGQALLNAAGPQFQDDCDRIISSQGQLKTGECVITDARGKLCCKKVIHVVGPTFDLNKSQRAQAQLKKAVKESLKVAEKCGCISVALPTISKNKGFDLNMCAVTIIKAVKEYLDEDCEDNILKKIHLVDNEGAAVQAMERAVRQEFGNHGISHSQQTSVKDPTHPVKQDTSAGSGTNCLGQVKTKEGLEIILTTGQIENAMTDVTVNTVFEDLVLNKGAVSNAILKVAGPKLQQLVNAMNASANVGEIIVTEGCNLKSKHVFHAVAPHWDKGQGASEKILGAIFKDCLDKAEDTGMTSISFPAIGTGNLGFPKDQVASLMLNEISSFSSKKLPKNLKTVAIILYSGDAQTIQVFIDEFKKKFPNASVDAIAPQSQGPFSKVVSSSGMHETKMGSVDIQVVTGDITKETTDVIVNSSNESFSLKSGVSKAILDAAGQAVETECQTLGAQPHPGMIMTQPGNLQCKKILHLTGQTDPIKINKEVKEALQMCVKNSFTSVSFPAIGTGNVQAGQVADAMLDAVIDVLRQYPLAPLKKVRIVIFQPPMLKEFYNSLGTKIKSLFYFGGDTDDKPQKVEDFVIEALETEPTCFYICSDTQAKVDSAKQWINDLISKEIETNILSDDTILCLTDADRKCIADIQKTIGVSIRTENINSKASITIEGISKDVLKATKEIHGMLKKAREVKELKKKVELTDTVAEWQYQQQGHQFQSFDSMTNFHLEQALEQREASVKIKVLGHHYTVTMPSGPASDSQGRTLQIKRIDKLKDIPEHWEPMPAKTICHPVTIQAGTAEYTEVQNLFQQSCKMTITKIERIQNPTLWKTLQVKKREMDQRNGHQNNEKRLFHGTCHTTVTDINHYGFNRSYAGKNAACYGNGTYFAVHANYSASNTYSKPNPNGEKFMYLCRVLTGDFTTGQQNMIVPPAKGAVSVHKYDSVVDKMAAPSMFVIFHDSQACPEYLITFK
uniref:Poly [ADP-ribose] polymerase n=1 Tax=Echeneis naucrates TaxID=173247 RepID=A0A665VB48_ECHNA